MNTSKASIQPRAPSRNPAGRPRSTAVDDSILRTVLCLVRETGYASVTIDAIAAASGVGKPSIYRRWSSKAEIVTAAVSRQAARDLPVADTGRFRADLTAALLAVAQRLREVDGPVVRSLFAEAQLNDRYRPIFQGFIRQRRREIYALVERAQQTGQARGDIEADLIVDEVFGVLIYRLLVGHGAIDDDLVRRHLQHVFRALNPENSGKASKW